LIRRDHIALLANGVLGLGVASLCPMIRARSASAQTDRDLIERWMNEWMGASKAPAGTLYLSRFKDPIYFLLKPITWKPNPGQDNLPEVHVPKGFVTDLTSVPRIFWTLLRPDGDYTYPAIIHDFLYWTQYLPRPSADLIFEFAMQDFGIDSTTTATIYHAVRLAGQSAWDQNAADKASGEKRVLKRYPQDPRITWAQWKMRPDVFE
jgi:Protein of unknown function (DUF1353)